MIRIEPSYTSKGFSTSKNGPTLSPIVIHYCSGGMIEGMNLNCNSDSANEFCTSRNHRKTRIALYSHDTMGLGHVRRNLLIAKALANSALRPEILLITGAPQATAFSLPGRTSCLALPSLRKESTGEYRSHYRGVSLRSLIDFRSGTIRTAIEEFDPDILIVDKVPRGALRELDFTLEFLRGRNRTTCILGLRDVLDEPDVVKREWKSDSLEDVIRDYYDYIWIYGDPRIYDPVQEYEFSPSIAEMVTYTGYHDQRLRLSKITKHEEMGPFILCLVGGGQDGARLVETFARCIPPPETQCVIIAGPFMPRHAQRRLERWATRYQHLKVLDFLAEPASLLNQATRIIAMGGYNTICEILSFQKPALIVPRVVPRREQLIRAERLRELGFVDVLNWDDVTPETLTRWLHEEKQPPQINGKIDMKGLERIPQFLSEILSNTCSETQSSI